MRTNRLLFIAFLGFLLLRATSPASAQTWNQANRAMCFNELATYTLSGVDVTYRIAAQNPAAVVTGGSLSGATGTTTPPGNGIYTYTVVWDGTGSPASGTIAPRIEKPIYKADGVTIDRWELVTTIPTLTITLRNMAGKQLGPITATGDLAFGGNTPITLCAAAVTVVAGEPAGGYLWTIPSGWVYSGNGNAVSNGSALLIRGSNANCITVTPTAQGATAQAKVSAVDTYCNDRTYTAGSVSQESQLTINRPTPTLTTISDRSPSGGDFTLTCGDQSDYHFRATSSAVPANGARASA